MLTICILPTHASVQLSGKENELVNCRPKLLVLRLSSFVDPVILEIIVLEGISYVPLDNNEK